MMAWQTIDKAPSGVPVLARREGDPAVWTVFISEDEAGGRSFFIDHENNGSFEPTECEFSEWRAKR